MTSGRHINNAWLLKRCDVQSTFNKKDIVWTSWTKVVKPETFKPELFIDKTSANQKLILDQFESQPWASSLRRSLTSLGVGPSGTNGLPTFGGRPFLRRLPLLPSPINCRSELGGRPLRPSIAKIRGMTSSSFNKLHCKPLERKQTQRNWQVGKGSKQWSPYWLISYYVTKEQFNQ